MTKQLTKEEQDLHRYYEDVHYTMSTPGWAHLVEDAKESRNALANIMNVHTADDLHQRQGRLRELDTFIELKDTFKRAHTALLAEQDVTND